MLSERHQQELHQYFRREHFRLWVDPTPPLSRVNEAFCSSLQMLKLARLASEPEKRNGQRGDSWEGVVLEEGCMPALLQEATEVVPHNIPSSSSPRITRRKDVGSRERQKKQADQRHEEKMAPCQFKALIKN